MPQLPLNQQPLGSKVFIRRSLGDHQPQRSSSHGQFHDVPCLSGPSLMIWHAPGSQQACTETNKGLVSQPCAAGKGRFHAGWWLSPRICNLNWFVTWKTNEKHRPNDRLMVNDMDHQQQISGLPNTASQLLPVGHGLLSFTPTQRDQLHSSCLAMF